MLVARFKDLRKDPAKGPVQGKPFVTTQRGDVYIERTLISSRGRVVLARGIGCLHSTHCQFAAARLVCLKSIVPVRVYLPTEYIFGLRVL